MIQRTIDKKQTRKKLTNSKPSVTLDVWGDGACSGLCKVDREMGKVEATCINLYLKSFCEGKKDKKTL